MPKGIHRHLDTAEPDSCTVDTECALDGDFRGIQDESTIVAYERDGYSIRSPHVAVHDERRRAARSDCPLSSLSQ